MHPSRLKSAEINAIGNEPTAIIYGQSAEWRVNWKK